MPRVKKSIDAYRSREDGEELPLPTMNTMQFVDEEDAKREKAERETFDANALLEELFPDKSTPARTCPLCHQQLLYDEVTTKTVSQWCYYRCPAVNDYTKCFVACGEDDDDVYLQRVKDTLHPLFMPGPSSYDPSHMRCYCHKSLILALSKSEKNRLRLYFKCPKGECSSFQWADDEPVGKVRRWLYQGVDPDAKGMEQRHKPYDLAKPIPRQPPCEARCRR